MFSRVVTTDAIVDCHIQNLTALKPTALEVGLATDYSTLIISTCNTMLGVLQVRSVYI